MEKELIRDYIIEAFKPEKYGFKAFDESGKRLLQYLNGWYGLLNSLYQRDMLSSPQGILQESKSIFLDALYNNGDDFLTDINYKMSRMIDKHRDSLPEAKFDDIKDVITILLSVGTAISGAVVVTKSIKGIKLSYESSRLYKYTKDVIVIPKMAEIINKFFNHKLPNQSQMAYEFRKLVDSIIDVYPAYQNILVKFRG